MDYKTKTVNPVSGQRLKAILKERGVTHEELAEILGVTPTHIGYMCQGRRAIPEKRAREIGNYLRIRPEYLLGIDDYPTRSREELIKTVSAIDKKWAYFTHTLNYLGYEVIKENPIYEESGDPDPFDDQEEQGKDSRMIEETITGISYTIRTPSGKVVTLCGERLETLVNEITRSAQRYIKEAIYPDY